MGANQAISAYDKAKLTGGRLDPQAREELILEYAPLIRFVAGRIALRLPSHLSLDDLISAGVLGLIDAVDKYDPNQNAKFKTYAEYRIRGAILDELRAMDWVPRSIRRKSAQMEKAFNALVNSLGREPTEEEMADELGVDLDGYFRLYDETAGLGLFSIVDAEADAGHFVPGTLVDSALKSNEDNPEEQFDKEEIKRVIAEAIEQLPQKDQFVISLYYYDELTMKEIGQVLDYTESRICQIHSQAMMKLRARLRRHLER